MTLCPTGIFSENIVVKGLQLWKAVPGSILTVCPSMSSEKTKSSLVQNLGSSDNAKIFAQAMATMKRSCIDLKIHRKRDCTGTTEEARGERGVFASIHSEGVIAVGDIAILQTPSAI